MHGSRPKLPVLFIAIVMLLALGAGSAQASPAGDDDTSFAGTATAFSEISFPGDVRPMTDQDSDGTNVTASVHDPDGQAIRLNRFDINGSPTGFGGDGVVDDYFSNPQIRELLDVRILTDHTIVVVARTSDQGIWVFHYSSEGQRLDELDQSFGIPEDCADMGGGTGTDTTTTGSAAVIAQQTVDAFPVAARVTAGGGLYALWDCDERSPNVVSGAPSPQLAGPGHLSLVTAYGPTDISESAAHDVPFEYGSDLELGPDGRPYVLGLFDSEDDPVSRVYRLDTALTDFDPADGSDDLPGEPVDLAVDSASRSLVWTTDGDSGTPWDIRRLDSQLHLDTGWGAAGLAQVTDPTLGSVFDNPSRREPQDAYLLVRPGDKVLVNGPNASGDGRVIAGLTSQGAIDTAWATNGFKQFVFTGPTDQDFVRISEPTLQGDGKVLVPFTSSGVRDLRSFAPRVAPPPGGDNADVGVTRLNPDPATAIPTVVTSRPVTISAGTICGRRAISLVRADLRGRKVKLTGLVGSKLFGKKVTIGNNYGAKRVTVRASATGNFTATVARPPRAKFVKARYRAKSGSAKSPRLKLPQSLTSKSVKAAAGKITVKGKVKKSVLGKRNRVIIRRLVCGHYRTVGTAKPDASGNYTVTFAGSAIRGVSFYRAETRVLRKPTSKVYVIQYARAIAIRTTSQTG